MISKCKKRLQQNETMKSNSYNDSMEILIFFVRIIQLLLNLLILWDFYIWICLSEIFRNNPQNIIKTMLPKCKYKY